MRETSSRFISGRVSSINLSLALRQTVLAPFVLSCKGRLVVIDFLSLYGMFTYFTFSMFAGKTNIINLK